MVDNTGKVVQHEIFLVQNGFGQGWFLLENSAGENGNLLLRAYTDYLKNYGNEAFQRKSIQVSQIKNSFQLPKTEHRFNKTEKMDISFFPEGGFLLNEEPGGVAFKVIGGNGKGIPVSGILFDEMKKPVLRFHSTYKGAGKFYFYPEAGRTYNTKINGYDGFEFRLPDAQESGAKIMLVNQDSHKLQLIIQAKNVKHKFPLNLVCMHRGKGIFSLEITHRDVNKILKIDAAKLKGGINRLVLLDKNLTPLSERFVFNEKPAVNQLQVRLNEETFSTRENVQVNIKDTTTSEISFLSVAVVDENYVPAGGVSQNIASYLLLDSELNGYIESPADYFVSDDSLSSLTKLDLLMTTNGWSNFLWNNLEKDSVKIEHQSQFGFNFEGQVKRAIGNKALPEGDVSLILFKNDSTSQFFDQTLESDGKFRFNNIFFTDSASVFVQARNKRNRNNVQFNMKLPDFSPVAVDSSYLKALNDTTKIPFSVYRNRYLNEMKLKTFRPEKNNILMDEIEVTAQKPEPKIKTGTPRKNNGAYRLTWEMTAGSFDIVEYLAHKVPGISKIRTEENELYLKLTPSRMTGIASFFVDGYRYITYDEARSYNINDFKTIEIISPPMSYAYGAHGIWGAINLTLKTGDDIALDRPLLGGIVEKIKGFAPFREFYSPKYSPENINSEAPDLRNTLYWNPNLVLANGESEAYFFTSDNISRYKIFVEGISENGTICLGNADFSVDKYQNLAKNSAPAKAAEPDTMTHEFIPKAKNKNKKPELPALKISTAKNKNPGKDFITGKVQDKFGDPVEFATLLNSTKQKSAITNASGEFLLEAETGDSVKIQHLNFKTNAFRIQKKEELFILSEKDFQIGEVLVSPKVAFELFDKSCENTWKTFKEENISRAYCRCTKKENGQTALVADFDLDIVQKKTEEL